MTNLDQAEATQRAQIIEHINRLNSTRLRMAADWCADNGCEPLVEPLLAKARLKEAEEAKEDLKCR